MLRTSSIFLLITALLALASCDSEPRFTISGHVEGIGSRPVTLTYYAGGKLCQLTATPVDDNFTFNASASEPSLATITLADGTLCAALIVENGQKITLRSNPSDPDKNKIEGSSASERLAQWIRENRTTLTDSTDVAVNSAIATYVGNNTADVTSGALLVLYYRTRGFEPQADSLLSLLAPQARTQAILQNFNSTLAPQLLPITNPEPLTGFTLYLGPDSTRYVSPRTHELNLLAFLGENKQARDSIIPQLKTLQNDEKISARVRLIEISTAPDSASWQASIASDSAKWIRAWSPAIIASSTFFRVGIPGSPYILLLDREGQQIYRGSAISVAVDTITKRINK